MGVDDALEHRRGEMSDAEVEAIGAGDQGMMVGFACNETPQLMPLSIALAQDLARSLSIARKSGQLPYLRPDGKSQVTVQYAFGKPARVDTVVVSTQHDEDVDQERIRRDVESAIVREVVPAALLDGETRILVNPTGRFVIGGPLGDSGLTGRKIIVDTYGGVARHGGGAFSGKDPTKVDRTGAYAARYVAKNVVAAGLAERFEVQLAYAIGVARPISISVETFGTGTVPDETLVQLIEEHFDLRPGAIIRDLGPAPAHLPPHRGVRALRAHGHRRPLGAHGQGRGPAGGGRHRRRAQPGHGVGPTSQVQVLARWRGLSHVRRRHPVEARRRTWDLDVGPGTWDLGLGLLRCVP